MARVAMRRFYQTNDTTITRVFEAPENVFTSLDKLLGLEIISLDTEVICLFNRGISVDRSPRLSKAVARSADSARTTLLPNIPEYDIGTGITDLDMVGWKISPTITPGDPAVVHTDCVTGINLSVMTGVFEVDELNATVPIIGNILDGCYAEAHIPLLCQEPGTS